MDKFKPGDTAICKAYIDFVNGTEHKIGDKILVTEDNKAYFNVMHANYDKETKQ